MRGKASNRAVESTASSKSKTGRAMLLDLNLPQLQNLLKRDPKSYREDFMRQLRHYESSMDILLLQPSQAVQDLPDLVLFVAHV
jgi:protein SDA1